jgi:hypothetical protein
MLLLLALATGLYLGLYFNVLVLAPFCTLGAGAYLVTSLWSGQGMLGSAAELILPLIAIQLGYFLGLIGRDSLAGMRARLNLGPSKRA